MVQLLSLLKICLIGLTLLCITLFFQIFLTRIAISRWIINWSHPLVHHVVFQTFIL